MVNRTRLSILTCLFLALIYFYKQIDSKPRQGTHLSYSQRVDNKNSLINQTQKQPTPDVSDVLRRPASLSPVRKKSTPSYVLKDKDKNIFKETTFADIKEETYEKVLPQDDTESVEPTLAYHWGSAPQQAPQLAQQRPQLLHHQILVPPLLSQTIFQ